MNYVNGEFVNLEWCRVLMGFGVGCYLSWARRHDRFIAGKITFFRVVRYLLYDNWFEIAMYDYPIIGTYSDNNLTKF